MLKRLGLMIITLGFMSAYAVTDTVSSAPTSAPVVQTTAEVVTAPMVFQMGKQKLNVYKTDVVQIAPTDTMCTDGVAVLLTTAMGNQLHDLTAQNLNQNLKILWNGLTLGDATVSEPLGASLCIGYVGQGTAQALVNEFGPESSNPPAATTTN